MGRFEYVFRAGTDASSHRQEQLDAITTRACPRGALELRSRLVVYRELLINSPQHFTRIY